MSKTPVRWKIPDDWDEDEDGYVCVFFCAPNSRTWRGIVSGQIADFSYGRHWDKRTGRITEAQEIARNIFESMCMVNCQELLDAVLVIATGITEISAKIDLFAQTTEQVFTDEPVLYGEGYQFEDASEYFVAKCNVANGIFDTIRGGIKWLEDNNVDLLAGAFGGITTGLAMGLLLAGPVGWTIVVVEMVVVALAAFLISEALNFQDVEDALDSVHEECVLALFNAEDAIVAKENFLSVVDAASPPLSPAELELIGIMLSADMLNQLWTPRSDLAEYESPDPIVCGGALLKIWTFDVGDEAFTFSDAECENGGTAAVSWNSIQESLEQTLHVDYQPWSKAVGENISPIVSIPLTPGASIQMDYGGSSDEVNTRYVVLIEYDDASEEEAWADSVGSGTVVLTTTETKTLRRVTGKFQRSNASTPYQQDFTCQLLEIRVYGA